MFMYRTLACTAALVVMAIAGLMVTIEPPLGFFQMLTIAACLIPVIGLLEYFMLKLEAEAKLQRESDESLSRTFGVTKGTDLTKGEI